MAKSSAIKLIKPNLSPQAIKAVADVIESGRLVCGPVVERFERGLAEYLGVSEVVCVSSGTAALHLALLAAGVGPGDEVIVPAFTFPATANVVEHIGARPIFVDVSPGGINIDVDKLVDLISRKTKAIMPVHAFGFPAAIDRILEIGDRHGIPVIEDAACALGSRFKGKMCGTFGAMAAFSFHPRKLLTTGEGGAIAVKDKHTSDLLKSLRNHGNDNGEFCHAGYNYRMTELQAAIGLTQLEYYDDYIGERGRLAGIYRQFLGNDSDVKIEVPEPNAAPNWQTLLAQVGSGIGRDKLINFLAGQGVEATIGTYCVPLTPYYRRKYGYKPNDFPWAYEAFNNRISLPLYHHMPVIDIERVVEAIRRFEKSPMEVVSS